MTAGNDTRTAGRRRTKVEILCLKSTGVFVVYNEYTEPYLTPSRTHADADAAVQATHVSSDSDCAKSASFVLLVPLLFLFLPTNSPA